MYRSRRTLQPQIPSDASEFCEMLPTTNLGNYYKFSVTNGNHIGAIFFSSEMMHRLDEITNIQFDGTFYTVPKQFSQLWTIFVDVGRHTLPAIHCLMTSKSQELYRQNNIPQFKPLISMSDWEPAARNAFHEIYPDIKIYGCWFHYTQRIWARTQKLGLSQTFRNNLQFTKYVKQLMAIPFLPPSLIYPTHNLLQTSSLENDEMIKFEKLKKYFKRRWLNQICPEELSIYELSIYEYCYKKWCR